jgi:transcription antitermination factor NusG
MTEWHAIKSKPGAEGRALIGIEASGMGAFLPVELIRKTHRGEREVTWKPLFPGYLFACCEPSRDLPRLLEIDGVVDVLRPGGRLARVPDRAIEAIRKAQEMGAFDYTRAGWFLTAEDKVRILGGPFAGLVARIKSAKSKNRIEVIVDFVHKITVGIDKLEKISA